MPAQSNEEAMTRDEHDPPSDSDVVVVREVVGAAQSREELDAFVERLTTSGFDRSDVSLTASASTSRRIGAATRSKRSVRTAASDP